MRARPVADVPVWVKAALAGALALQLGLAAVRPPPRALAEELGIPPSGATLRLAAFGEPIALAKLVMLYIQAFDYQAGTRVLYRNLDYAQLEAWLAAILALDPGGQYPLMAASRVYAEVPDPAKQRRMLDFIAREYLKDPNRRWPWLAHAVVIAKHELHDLPLAREYAVALRQHTTAPNVPAWVRQMEPFILEDMNELEAARVLIGGLLASGQITDEREMRLLDGRLKQLEARNQAREAPERPSKPRR